MKKNELTKLRAKSVVELEKEAQKLKLQAVAEKAAIITGSEKNLRKSFLTRKKLSQVLTLISENKNK